ncbi:MAG: DUF4160 domain-containing protein [Bdellovibrionota bacterium]
MPKLYEYLGIIIFFYSNEHEPIHVHGRYGEFESKIEIVLKNGIVECLKLQNVTGKKPLPAVQSKEFKKLATKLADEIVQSWVNYFVYHKKIVTKKIAGKL